MSAQMQVKVFFHPEKKGLFGRFKKPIELIEGKDFAVHYNGVNVINEREDGYYEIVTIYTYKHNDGVKEVYVPKRPAQIVHDNDDKEDEEEKDKDNWH